MKILLHTLKQTFDITTLVDPFSVSILTNLEADNFNSGELKLTNVNKNVFLSYGLDMSRPIPNWSLITIELPNRLIEMYVENDLVSNTREDDTHYNHYVKLIEPLKVLTRINVPSNTITQPKELGFVSGERVSKNTLGTMTTNQIVSPFPQAIVHRGALELAKITTTHIYDIRNYNFVNERVIDLDRSQKEIEITSTQKEVAFVNLEQNTTIINGMEITANEPIALNVCLRILNPYFNLSFNKDTGIYKYELKAENSSQDLVIEIYADTVKLKEETITINGGKPVNTNFKADMVSDETIRIWNTFWEQNKGTPQYESLFVFEPKAIPSEYEIRRTYKIDNLPTTPTTLKVRVKTANANTWRWYMSGEKYKGWFGNPAIPKKEYTKNYTKKLYLLEAQADIYEKGKDAKYLDDYVKKVLSLNEDHNITLNADSESMLSMIKAPEYTFSNNNLYEITNEVAKYTESIPSLKVSQIYQTEWVLATESEYNNGNNKISVKTPSDRLIWHLNTLYANKPLGFVAKRIIDSPYEVIETDSTDFNSADYTFDLTIPEGSNGIDVWNAFENQYPQYAEQIDPNSTYAFRGDDGLGYSYWKLVDNTANLYAKVVASGITTEIKELSFTRYNDLENVIQDPLNPQQQVKIRLNEDYLSNIELNTDNLVSDDFYVDTGFIPLQTDADGNQQITTNNLGLALESGAIYKIKKAEICLNKAITLTDNQVIPADKVFDFTELLVEKSRYETLLNLAEYSLNERTKPTPTKNQVLYYIQGDNRIYNMSFTGTHKPVDPFTLNPGYNRAIYEMVARLIVFEYGAAPKNISGLNAFDEGKIDNDRLIKVRIEYYPYMKTRATIFKDDQSGFQEQVSRYYNENAKLNDPKTLGNIAQADINRLGNTQNEVEGYYTLSQKLQVGNKDSNGRILTTINEKYYPTRIDYKATYIKDYAIKNDYVGIDSAHRQYEIPKDDTVLRVDKKVVKVYLGLESKTDEDTTITALKPLFNSLSNQNYSSVLKVALIKTYNTLNDRIVSVYKPIQTLALGKGFTLSFQMKDNYSAGTKRVQYDGKWWQQDIPYVDNYGNVMRMEVQIGNHNSSFIKGDRYPEALASDNLYLPNIKLDYYVNKDSREITALSVEVKFLSDNADLIHIFNGLALYNTYVKGEIDYQIRVGYLKRKISRSTKKLSPNDYEYTPQNTITVYDKNFVINVATVPESAVGYIIYEKDSEEPLLALYRDNNGTLNNTYYFYTKK